MKLADYVKRLDAHDWHYSYSDDPRVFWPGEKERNELLSLSKISPEHREFFENRRAHANDKSVVLKELPQ